MQVSESFDLQFGLHSDYLITDNLLQDYYISLMRKELPKEPNLLRDERIRNSKPITRFFRNLKKYRRKKKIDQDKD